MKIRDGYSLNGGDCVFSEVSETVEKIKRANPDAKIIDLGVGDVKIPLPAFAAKVMKRSAAKLGCKRTFSGYPPDHGYDFLRNAVCSYYRLFDCEVLPDEVFITAGAKCALADFASLIEGKAFVHLPNYPLYTELCAAYGIKCLALPTSLSDCASVVGKSDCDVCFICSPCNPTGDKIEKNELSDLAKIIAERRGAIILDAAYAFMDDGYVPPFYNDDLKKTVVEVRTFSKSASFTGVRCGFVVVKKENPLHAAYVKAASLRYNGVNVTAQKAAFSLFSSEGKREILRRRAVYVNNAEILAAPFVARGYKFSGGVRVPYLFVDVGQSGRAFFEELLEEKHVCVTPGEGFGGNNSVRLSCLCSYEDAVEGANRIATFLDERSFLFGNRRI